VVFDSADSAVAMESYVQNLSEAMKSNLEKMGLARLDFVQSQETISAKIEFNSDKLIESLEQ